jgi:hypothetical protein
MWNFLRNSASSSCHFSITEHSNATTYIIQFQGYTGQACAVGSFGGNMARASERAHDDSEAEKSVDEPAQTSGILSIKTTNPYQIDAKRFECINIKNTM